jgi:hypothetical protein
LPVVEKFANYILKEVLPGLQKWVDVNKDKLAASLQTAAEQMIKLFAVAVSFGEWAANNTDTIKALAIAIGSLWATSKVYAFAKAIGTVTLAFKGMSLAALGTGAAGAAGVGAAAAGAIPLAIAAGIGALTFGLSKVSPGEKARAKAKTAQQVLGSNFPMSPGASDVAAGIKAKTVTVPPKNNVVDSLIDAINENTKTIKKKTAFDIATENAVKANLARQKALSGSTSLAIGEGGKIYGPRNDAGKIVVNVSAGNVVGSTDALIETVQNGLQTANRRNGGGGNRYETMLIV